MKSIIIIITTFLIYSAALTDKQRVAETVLNQKIYNFSDRRNAIDKRVDNQWHQVFPLFFCLLGIYQLEYVVLEIFLGYSAVDKRLYCLN